LEPVLIDWLKRIADPNQTLTHFAHFVERYGARSLLYETLLQNPRLLELLIRLFDASRFLSEIVIRRPQLIERSRAQAVWAKHDHVLTILPASRCVKNGCRGRIG
jgi:glutamine synthetase adenylyltransferase